MKFKKELDDLVNPEYEKDLAKQREENKPSYFMKSRQAAAQGLHSTQKVLYNHREPVLKTALLVGGLSALLWLGQSYQEKQEQKYERLKEISRDAVQNTYQM